MRAPRNATRARPRWSAWLATAAFAFGASFIACSGDGPTAPPELDLARSTLTVAPGPYVAGQSYVATFTARDGDGDLFTDALSITVGLSGGTSAGTFTPVTTTSPGVWTTTFGATTAGTPSQVTLSIGGTPITTGLPSITVVPGAASPVESSVSASSASVQSGMAATITITIRDALGNLRAAGGDVVTVGKGAGTSDGTLASVIDQANGTYLSSFTGTVPGTPRTITAAIGGVAITSALPAITVTAPPPSPAMSTVTVGSATVASGAQTTLTLTARDAAGAALPTGGRVVQFTVGGGTSAGTTSDVTDVGNGTYTATFTATTAGTPSSVSASIDAAPLTSVAPTITVVAGAVSLAQSTVSVSAASVVSGAATTLTLSSRDAAGNALTTGGLDVAFVLGTGTSAGTLSPVTDEGDGTYTAVFTATTAGTARSIGATIGGAAVTTPGPAITVTPGALSLAQTTVTVAAASIAAGDATTITLTARDASGNALGGGGATVAFSLGAGTSVGTIGPTTDQGDGTYTATFTATGTGSARTILASVNGDPVTSTAPTITVSAGAVSPSQSTVSVADATVASGSATTVMLTARDGLGNILTGGGLTVAFTLGGGSSAGTFSLVTDAGDGTYTATFTATVAGTARVIGATIGGVAVTSAPATITVTPGALSLTQTTVVVGVPTLPAGDTTSVTLTARDAAGNVLAGGGLAVAFSLGAGTSGGALGPVTDRGDGTYTASLTATAVGSARSVLATVGGESVASAAPTFTVIAGAVSLGQSSVSVSTATTTSGSVVTLTLVTRDAAGNALPTGGLAVAFTKGSGTSDGDISVTTDLGDGSYTATFTATAAGDARAIGATIGGAPLTSAAPTITVTPGPVSVVQSSAAIRTSSLASGDTATITVTARDAFGNALGTGGAAVEVRLGGGTSAGDIGPVVDAADGTYRALFTATTVGSARTIVVTIDGDTLTSPAPSVTVTAGALSLAQSTVTVGSATLTSGTSTTLTFTARDAGGNALGAGGAAVAFTKGGGTSDGTIGPVTDASDGTYTASFTATFAGSARTIGATVGGEAVTSAAPTITVTPGAISPATSTIAASSASLTLGQSSTLSLIGRDAAGNPLTSGGATVVFTKVSGSADGPLSATTDVGDGTYTATFTAATGGTPRVIGATIDGAAVTTALPAITVVAPPVMELGASYVTLTAQQGTLSDSVLVAVGNVGGDSLTGLSATSGHVSGPATCASIPWLLAPTFDKGGVANPVSLMRLRGTAVGLELGTCVRRVVVTTATPDVAPETTLVALVVGRSAAATGVVNVVMMGDAGNNVVQNVLPTPVLRLDNAGRGTVTNLSATILAQSGFAECVDPFDEATCTPWLAPSDLVFSSTQLPSTLSIVSQVRPFSATATVRVSGTGMTARDFNINVAFNVLPALVTNPRNLKLRGVFSQSASVLTSVDTLIAFNQNTAHPGLTNYRIDPATPPPTWIRSQVTQLPDGTARLVFWVAPEDFDVGVFGQARDTLIESAAGWRNDDSDPQVKTRGIGILADCTDPDDCFDFGADSVVPKRFELPFSMVMEPGLTLPVTEQTVFAADTTTFTFDVPIRNLGGGEIGGLVTDVQPSGNFPSDPFDWVESALVGGATATPATLRLTLRPGLVPADRTEVRADIYVRAFLADGVTEAHTRAFQLTLRRTQPR